MDAWGYGCVEEAGWSAGLILTLINSPPCVDRIWGMRVYGGYYNIPKPIFYLLKGDCKSSNVPSTPWGIWGSCYNIP